MSPLECLLRRRARVQARPALRRVGDRTASSPTAPSGSSPTPAGERRAGSASSPSTCSSRAPSPASTTQAAALFDPSPLHAQLRDTLPWGSLHDSIDRERLLAFGVAATDVVTGRSTLFADGRAPAKSTPTSRVVPTRITAEHCLASAAIPGVFPPVAGAQPASWSVCARSTRRTARFGTCTCGPPRASASSPRRCGRPRRAVARVTRGAADRHAGVRKGSGLRLPVHTVEDQVAPCGCPG